MEQLIFDLCFDKDINDAEESLINTFGKDNVEYIDEKIDDICDIIDNETYYIMARCYKVKNFNIKIYYSDYDLIVSYILIR